MKHNIQTLYATRVGNSIPALVHKYPISCLIHGRVHSVFGHAINLDFGFKELITLLDGSSNMPSNKPANMPTNMQAAAIEVEFSKIADLMAIIQNQTCTIAQEKNACTIHLHNTLSIDLSHSTVCSLTLGYNHVTANSEAGFADKKGGLAHNTDAYLLAYWKHILSTHWIFNSNTYQLFMHQIAIQLFNGLKTLVLAMQNRTTTILDSAFQELCGLGLGLTPSGDDMLLGWYFGSLLRKKSLQDDQDNTILKRARRLFIEASHAHNTRTNKISKSFFYQAAQRKFSEILIAFAKDYIKDPKAMYTEHINRIKSYGNYSGEDILLGMYCGLYNQLPQISK